MKILAINWQDQTNPQSGGAEVHFEEILTRVVSWGHQVTLACSSYPNAPQSETINSIDIHRRGGRMTFNYVAPSMIKKILKENKYDLIVEDVNKIPFYLPLFVSLPHLIVIPHLFGSTIFRETNPILASYVYMSEKPIPFVYRKSNFLVISDSTKNDLISRGVPPEKIGVAECGVDHDFYKPDNSINKFKHPTLIYLGRIKKYKSVHHIIEMLPQVKEKIRDIKLIIVGAGDYLDDLKSLTEKLNLTDSVTLTGFVSHEEKLRLLRQSHLAIYPSPKEGWGITNIEANACGTPVVASNVPGLKDSVDPGVSGLLYEYGNLPQLASSVIKVLSDQIYYDKLVAGALKWATKFTWDSCAENSFSWFEKTVKEWKHK